MLKEIFVASLLVVSQSFAAEPTTKTNPSLWEITLTRADASGKTLSQAKAPLAVFLSGNFDTKMVINMGTAVVPRLWSVGCTLGGKDKKLIEFEISDTTRTISWTTDGDSATRAAELFDIETSWHGPGRYLVFTMDGETLTADIHPASGTKIDNGNRADSKVIVVTRRDSDRKILSQTTAPWPARPDVKQSLAILFGTKDTPQTRVIRFYAHPDTLRVHVGLLLPVKEELGGTRVRRLNLIITESPINASGKYIIQELDGETLEAEIRPAGKTKTGSENNGE